MKKVKAGPDGWSEWITPVATGYRMACCDCGLVHTVDFKIAQVLSTNPDGIREGVHITDDRYKVLMRVRRNNRSTAAMRRNKDKSGEENLRCLAGLKKQFDEAMTGFADPTPSTGTPT